MAVTVTPTPASGDITAKSTVVKFDLAGLDLNDSTDYSATAYPTWTELRYYIAFELGGIELGRSHAGDGRIAPSGDREVSRGAGPHRDAQRLEGETQG